MSFPFLLHIPHASTFIPEEYRADFLTDPAEEMKYMTDWYTDELFDLPAPKLVFPVSRLVCDAERFRDDGRETMARRGMGAYYVRGYGGASLRRADPAKREAVLRRYYDPHHRALNAAAARALEEHGSFTVIDCHSFSASPLPYELDRDADRPDVCIGTDPYHTPAELSRALAGGFGRRGYSVAFNRPYSGAMVPGEYYGTDPRVRSVMIELNRGLYLEGECAKNARFRELKDDIASILCDFIFGAKP